MIKYIMKYRMNYIFEIYYNKKLNDVNYVSKKCSNILYNLYYVLIPKNYTIIPLICDMDVFINKTWFKININYYTSYINIYVYIYEIPTLLFENKFDCDNYDNKITEKIYYIINLAYK